MQNRKEGTTRYLGVFVVLILLLLCGTTTFFSARYVGAANGVSQTAIAGFNVSTRSAANTALTLDMQEGDREAVFTFDIVGNSDVSFTYDVTVTLPDHDVDGLIIRVGGQNATVRPGVTVYEFTDVGTVPYGDQTEVCDLTFDATAVTEDVYLMGITVSIRAEQVD